MDTSTIITIDGPAGSGKSSVAATLAKKLGFGFLDTGAMYRAATLGAMGGQVDLTDPDALARFAEGCRIEMTGPADQLAILLDGKDVTDAIRTPEVTNNAHYIASNTRIRELMVDQQRRIAGQLGSAVTEGRDQGTVAFPDATVKFYLDASAQCRARRRFLQLQAKGVEADYEQILADQQQRDARDAARTVGPLKPAADAITIDTSEMSFDQVVQTLYDIVRERIG